MAYLLWGYFIAFPIYCYFTLEQEKQSVIDQPSKRIGVYRATMLFLWLPTLVLLALLYNSTVSAADIGLQWQWNLANQIGVAILIAIVGYFVVAIKQLTDNEQAQHTASKELDYVRWMMPATAKEYRYVMLGVSISAGVCEELLFRGYLLHLLGEYVPTYAAVILSSIAFGLGHLYQGLVHALRPAILGVIFSLIYLATDSLVLPILLHVFIDMYGSTVGYIVCSKKQTPLATQQ